MIRRLPLLLMLLASPSAADVATIDQPVLERRKDRNGNVAAIEKADRDRYGINESITCSMYRPGRKDDPVAAANANPSIAGLVRRVAREEGVDENQFLALVYQESRFNPCARSGAGAIGLAQLMPGTAADLGVNAYSIEQNLRGGARYFKQQLRRFNGNISLALAAYNAGAGNVDKHGGIPPFRETQTYVAAITQKWLPAFGGSDKSGIPLNYGGTGGAYEGMRMATLNAMAATSAAGDGLGDVASWFQQFGALESGTLQDSWDHNSGARNANLEMLNRLIQLGASLADLVNSNNAVTLSDVSGASRSADYAKPANRRPTNGGLCDVRPGLIWSGEAQGCVQKREQDDELLLNAQ
ncbi:lytic transglycosylase domain-containing protein [Mesorhizobium sp. B292B1B]|uniref:lytic transglycosylase domain-containing protein n=1 Tax=unclassified Mesorhizobium TaxID=325217 RepID=UPI00112C78B7|nr:MULTISPECIES: lytic transglycosylase domain-containing protein [unclassified Mesorhizobium]MBZ9922141.1 lytic transglycosylase domain-containing protein [Mesorhizobium sp. BR1-1-7]MBZ9967777.1 lytic transglycosylase domain-containing protein [Mesorhizobium sp. BR1-1-2]MCA0016394.1 lytic transglycosylase domain-containing protein [Mesorhizobium sp. B294B1A1]MCA0038441.1 lytic transglycosylase domain-containing protein [Mesorhizobium sp. B292B1B]TPM37329.1 lytic transglycosylase domain-contai